MSRGVWVRATHPSSLRSFPVNASIISPTMYRRFSTSEDRLCTRAAKASCRSLSLASLMLLVMIGAAMRMVAFGAYCCTKSEMLKMASMIFPLGSA